jgi:Double zinc ribbon
MNCPGCGAETTERGRFCTACGAALPAVCPACGSSNPAGAKFCADCGAPIGAGARPGPVRSEPTAAAAGPAPAGSTAERRPLSVMFSSIKTARQACRRKASGGGAHCMGLLASGARSMVWV